MKFLFNFYIIIITAKTVTSVELLMLLGRNVILSKNNRSPVALHSK